ncbi:hypothetical protein E2C01_029771 [Portunus trituberculatus]|uniref:Uncharacterized protein n=1 Tax=Portunus trituberculatus TaxID=210409 RepID=A0A5B7ESV3_PORTR|nr:hypothetical protein [Portunus trituberculatus]
MLQNRSCKNKKLILEHLYISTHAPTLYTHVQLHVSTYIHTHEARVTQLLLQPPSVHPPPPSRCLVAPSREQRKEKQSVRGFTALKDWGRQEEEEEEEEECSSQLSRV